MDVGAQCAIALEETMHGQAAYELRNQGADSTSVPKEGCEYYLARLRLTYLIGCHQCFRVYRAADFCIEADGEMFGPTLSAWNKELDLIMYPADVGTGWVVFEVPNGSRAQRIRFTPSGSDLAMYFSLR
jgi:hypothetical protein